MSKRCMGCMNIIEDDYHVYVGGKYVITDAQMKKLIELDLDKAKDISDMLCKN